MTSLTSGSGAFRILYVFSSKEMPILSVIIAIETLNNWSLFFLFGLCCRLHRLITLYQYVHDALHARSGQAQGPLKLQLVRTDKEIIMGWVSHFVLS